MWAELGVQARPLTPSDGDGYPYFTVEQWVYISNRARGQSMVFYEHAGEATHKRNWMGLQGATGKAQCGVADSEMRLLFVLSNEPLVQRTWYHITCVFAGAGIESLVPEQDEMLYIFVDGQLEGSATVPQWGSGALGDIIPDGTAPLVLGAHAHHARGGATLDVREVVARCLRPRDPLRVRDERVRVFGALVAVAVGALRAAPR